MEVNEKATINSEEPKLRFFIRGISFGEICPAYPRLKVVFGKKGGPKAAISVALVDYAEQGLLRPKDGCMGTPARRLTGCGSI